MGNKRIRISESEADLICELRGISKRSLSRCGNISSYRVRISDDEFELIQKSRNENIVNNSTEHNDLLTKIKSLYSEEELKALAKGGGLAKEEAYRKKVNISKIGKHTIGVMTDTHIGSKYTNSDSIIDALHNFEKHNCECVLHAGDVTEGFSGREGHVFECTHFGFDSQLKECVRVFSSTKLKIIAIDGNHDRWGLKKIGANVVAALSSSLPNFVHAGSDMAVIKIGSIDVMLWHGEDGSSYATSYRVQKIIESLQGGTKPNILICGHTHKALTLFERNINAVSAGSMQFQTAWMRGKKLAANTGYYILEFEECDGEVLSFNSTFYPLYKM